jgi:paraquat-inducible protein A
MVLFAVANAFPIVGLSVNGDLVQTTLFGAVRILYRDGMWPLAGLVFFTTILMPMLQMAGIAYLLLPLPLGRVPPQPAVVFRLVHWAMSWGMTEVLILGVLVALVKLAHIAGVVPGIALWASGAGAPLAKGCRRACRYTHIGVGVHCCSCGPLRLSRVWLAVESEGTRP